MEGFTNILEIFSSLVKDYFWGSHPGSFIWNRSPEKIMPAFENLGYVSPSSLKNYG